MSRTLKLSAVLEIGKSELLASRASGTGNLPALQNFERPAGLVSWKFY